jgi:hypothetical protein
MRVVRWRDLYRVVLSRICGFDTHTDRHATVIAPPWTCCSSEDGSGHVCRSTHVVFHVGRIRLVELGESHAAARICHHRTTLIVDSKTDFWGTETRRPRRNATTAWNLLVTLRCLGHNKGWLHAWCPGREISASRKIGANFTWNLSRSWCFLDARAAQRSRVLIASRF